MKKPNAYPNLSIRHELRHIRANQVLIMQMLGRLLNKETDMAKSLDDILAAQATALDKITAETEVDKAIAAAFTADRQTIVDLRAQLAAAIAANDPAKLQAVADNMDAILAAQDVEAKTKAVLDNTDAG